MRQPSENSVVIGLDIGSGGARAYAVDRHGQVIAQAERAFTHPPYQPAPGRAEQDAHEWWAASRDCLRELAAMLGDLQVAALSVDATSGTFVPVDATGGPLMPALMYNDLRAAGLEAEVNAAAQDFIAVYGYTFPPAFALVKMLWLKRHAPDVFAATHKFLHAADFVAAHLTGQFDRTDTSNALKSGVDLLKSTWPDFIERDLGLPLRKFPQVVTPGTPIGTITTDAAAQTGLPADTPVVAGVSDGTASFLASGAREMGDWNVTIGTTIVVRGISDTLIRDPHGRYYCHRHPESFWLPGGASNTGGEGLARRFAPGDFDSLDEQAVEMLPSPVLVYPLARTGERMPFASETAQGFQIGDAENDAELFAAYTQGIALVAAWSLEAAADLGAPIDGDLYLTGGGAQGKTLGRALASVMGRPLAIPAEPEAAYGSALLAAGWAWFGGSVRAAQTAMLHSAQVIQPNPTLTISLRDKLKELQAECRQRQYLP